MIAIFEIFEFIHKFCGLQWSWIWYFLIYRFTALPLRHILEVAPKTWLWEFEEKCNSGWLCEQQKRATSRTYAHMWTAIKIEHSRSRDWIFSSSFLLASFHVRGHWIMFAHTHAHMKEYMLPFVICYGRKCTPITDIQNLLLKKILRQYHTPYSVCAGFCGHFGFYRYDVQMDNFYFNQIFSSPNPFRLLNR